MVGLRLIAALTAPPSEHDPEYATEPVPETARRPCLGIFAATVGIATALFYMQITSIIALRYGSVVALIAIAYATLVSAAIGFAIAHLAISTGWGTNLMARAVLGFRGASLFSLLFAANAIVYFGVEAAIMGASLSRVLPALPMKVIFPSIVLSLGLLVWYGIRMLERVQLATLLGYAALLVVALFASYHHAIGISWLSYRPAGAPVFGGSVLAALGLMNGAVFITGLVTADFARYIPRSQRSAGRLLVGVVFQTICFGLAGLLGLWFSVRYSETNPGFYLVMILGGWGTLLTIVTQFRINLANMYLGSIAIQNFFQQLLDWAPKRGFIIVMFGVVVSTALVFNAIRYLVPVLNVIGMFTLCFTSLILTEFLIVCRFDYGVLKHSPQGVIGKEWQGAALGSTSVATITGAILTTGIAGTSAQSGASFIAGFLQITSYLALSWPRIATERHGHRTIVVREEISSPSGKVPLP